MGTRWHDSQAAAPSYYRPHWGVPRLFAAADYSVAPRRRRSPPYLGLHRRPVVGGSVAGVARLVGGPRPKRDLRRYRRDLAAAADLEALQRDADLMQLLSLLVPRHRQMGGYGTVRYSPAPPRYAPQPKLFPDYEEGEEAYMGGGGEGLMRHGMRGAAPLGDAGAGRGGAWKRFGPPGYGLSAMPGFKRSPHTSAFRANGPHEPPTALALTPGDVYSLAKMLGVEFDTAIPPSPPRRRRHVISSNEEPPVTPWPPRQYPY